MQLCADDLQVSRHELSILPRPATASHYSSEIFLVAPRGTRVPTHVVKSDNLGIYDPQHEFEALKLGAKLLTSRESAACGVVHAVGYGSDPKYLVTRYQEGEILQAAFDAALRGRLGVEGLAEVRRHARLIAQWLSAFHRSGERRDGGMEPDQWVSLIAGLAGEVGRRFGGRRMLSTLVAACRRYPKQLAPDERSRLQGSRPNRGDARPKNFILGPDSVLYGFDMEGFGFNPLDNDCACMHHSLELDALRTPATTRRASEIWVEFSDAYVGSGNSLALVLMGYVHFVLDRAMKADERWAQQGWRRRVRDEFWIRERLRWLSHLKGDLMEDSKLFRVHI